MSANRIRCLAVALATVLAAMVLIVSPAPAADKVLTGTYRITAKLTLGPNTAGATSIKATASVSFFNGTVGQNVSNTVTVHRSGNAATIVVDVPYKWIVDTGAVTTIGVGIGATTSSPSGASAYTSTGKGVPLPANGATTPVTFLLAM